MNKPGVAPRQRRLTRLVLSKCYTGEMIPLPPEAVRSEADDGLRPAKSCEAREGRQREREARLASFPV